MRSYEQVYHVVWILLAVGICRESLRLKIWDAASGPVAGFIPFLAGILIGLSGLLLLVSGRGKPPSRPPGKVLAGGRRLHAESSPSSSAFASWPFSFPSWVSSSLRSS